METWTSLTEEYHKALYEDSFNSTCSQSASSSVNKNITLYVGDTLIYVFKLRYCIVVLFFLKNRRILEINPRTKDQMDKIPTETL